MVNLPDGLELSLLPELVPPPDQRVAQHRRCRSIAADEEAPQALDLGGDERTTDVLGIATLDAAPREHRRAVRHPHVGRRLRPDRAGRRGADRRRRRHAGGDARPGRRGHRHVVALVRARSATGSARPTAARSRWRTPSPRSPARWSPCWRSAPGWRGTCATTAATWPRCACSASRSAPPAGPVAPSSSASPCLVLAAVVAGGWLAVTLLLGGLPLLSLPVAGIPLDTAPAPGAAGGPRRPLGRGGRARRRAAPAPYAPRPPGPACCGRRRADGLESRSSAPSSAACARAPCCPPARCCSPRSRSASAVLGPVFSEAVTNSYVVTRLQETPPALTGLSRVFTPDSAVGARRGATRRGRRHRRRSTRARGARPTPTVQSERFSALRGVVDLLVARRTPASTSRSRDAARRSAARC